MICLDMSCAIFLKMFLRTKISDMWFLPSPAFVIRTKVWYSSQPLKEPKTFTRSQEIVHQYAPFKAKHKFEFYRNYLVSNEKEYLSLFIPKDLQSTGCSAAKLFSEFKSNGQDDDSAVEELNNALQFQLKDVSSNDLLEVIYKFANMTFTCRKIQIIPLVKTLDHVLLNQPLQTPVDIHLKMLDALFISPLYRTFSYSWKRVGHYCYKVNNFTPQQVVHLAYLLTKLRTLPDKECRFSFQEALAKVITKLNIQELGLVFFMLKEISLPISHPELNDTIFDVIAKNIEQFDSVVFSTFTEALLTTCTFRSVKGILELQNKILPHIGLHSLFSLTNIALSGLIINKVDPAFFEKLLHQAQSNVVECNETIISRLILMCASLNIRNEEFLEFAMKTLSSQEGEKTYLFVSCVKYLLCLGYREEKFVWEVLSEEYVESVLKSKSTGLKLDLDFIDKFVEVNMPEYKGPRLTTSNKKYILKVSRMCNHLDKMKFTMRRHHRLLGLVELSILNAYGPGLTVWKRILASYPPAVIMRFNKDLEIQKIPMEFVMAKPNDILKPDNDDHLWTVIVLSTIYNRGLDGNLNTITVTEGQHLEAFGYKPIVLDKQLLIQNKKNGNMADFVIKTAKETLASLSST